MCRHFHEEPRLRGVHPDGYNTGAIDLTNKIKAIAVQGSG
jgi:hypothetical protein